MTATTTPLAESIHIVLCGLRNSGKSMLINNLFEKEVAIVSATPGTTTDPVTRKMELGALGPVAITDTAGLDDTGDLGDLRIKKTVKQLETAQIAIFITRGNEPPKLTEKKIIEQIAEKKTQLVLALTFGDFSMNEEKLAWAKNYPFVLIDNVNRQGFDQLRKLLVSLADQIEYEITPFEGLVKENDLVVLVTPIDLAAPKGRLILPQVEAIRDLLDKDCATLIVKERELYHFYHSLTVRPALVVTDSQAFSKVAADIPEDQMLTSFSILFARKKGDLAYFIRGIKALKDVLPNPKVLVLESCSHHRQADDIGTVKIPRLFKQLVQADAEFSFERTLPVDEILKNYQIVINCASCMASRNKVMHRLNTLKDLKIPAVNYGLFLAWINGLLPRALEPFPYEHSLYVQSR